jgi:hypothetical protein
MLARFMVWVSRAEAFLFNGNEARLFTKLDMEEALIAILDREGIDDKEGLEEEREAIEDPCMLLLEAGVLLDCSASFFVVGAIAFIVR